MEIINVMSLNYVLSCTFIYVHILVSLSFFIVHSLDSKMLLGTLISLGLVGILRFLHFVWTHRPQAAVNFWKARGIK
jgi:hypothetical protein